MTTKVVISVGDSSIRYKLFAICVRNFRSLMGVRGLRRFFFGKTHFLPEPLRPHPNEDPNLKIGTARTRDGTWSWMPRCLAAAQVPGGYGSCAGSGQWGICPTEGGARAQRPAIDARMQAMLQASAGLPGST